jgi:hypothetical protein
MGEVYKDNSYIDLATENPFYDVDTNKPKYLGESGELPTGSSPLIYLPLRADDAGNNLGTGGDFTVNSGPYVGARGASEFLARSAEFDGSTGYLSRASALTGAVNTKTFSAALSIYFDSVVTSRILVFNGATDGDERFFLGLSGSNFIVLGDNSSGTTILFGRTDADLTSGQWNNILVSVDLTDTGKRNLYVNNVAVATTWSAYTDDTISIDVPKISISSTPPYTGNHYADDLATVFFSTDYIDFSQEANRLKFVDGLGYPVDLQPAIDAGDIPTPLIHMKFDDTSALGTNSGSGGDFTVNGTVTAGPDVKG